MHIDKPILFKRIKILCFLAFTLLAPLAAFFPCSFNMLNYSHGIITQMQFYDNTKDKRVELQDLKQRLIYGMDQR